MTAPRIGDPCFEPVVRLELPGDTRVRVVEVLATGSNGGAQEHLYGLLSRIDRERYDVRVVALSAGSAVRKIGRLGFPVEIIDEPDDDDAVDALADYLEQVRPDVLHDHMYRAEIVGTRAALRLAECGLARPYVLSTVHSSRVRSVEDRATLRALTPSMD
ncbi:MAG: glycosyltransferase, partial [Candidatus Limnocylindrales bacterium]